MNEAKASIDGCCLVKGESTDITEELSVGIYCGSDSVCAKYEFLNLRCAGKRFWIAFDWTHLFQPHEQELPMNATVCMNTAGKNKKVEAHSGMNL